MVSLGTVTRREHRNNVAGLSSVSTAAVRNVTPGRRGEVEYVGVAVSTPAISCEKVSRVPDHSKPVGNTFYTVFM